MPGKNDSLSYFAIEYGLPLESGLGGAETTYPEYIKRMKTMKRAPRTTRHTIDRSADSFRLCTEIVLASLFSGAGVSAVKTR
jgi:hypothetical protein